MHVGEVAEQERQRHDIKLRVDRIDDASEADVDRAGAHTFRDRSFVTELTVGKILDQELSAGGLLHFIGKALHGLGSIKLAYCWRRRAATWSRLATPL